MSTRIEDTLDKLQEINASIEGVRMAPTRMPDRLDSSDLPCALSYVGPAELNLAARGRRREARNYVIRLYVKEFASGTNVNDAYKMCFPFFDRFPEAYLADSVIAPSDETWEQLLFEDRGGDGGVVIIPLHAMGGPEANHYWSIEWVVTAIYKENL